jgi:hypothetical protein
MIQKNQNSPIVNMFAGRHEIKFNVNALGLRSLLKTRKKINEENRSIK